LLAGLFMENLVVVFGRNIAATCNTIQLFVGEFVAVFGIVNKPAHCVSPMDIFFR
jgi:hypothetical protein